MPCKYELYPFKIGEILVLKKNHPCGNNIWIVERTGQEIGIRCRQCNHFLVMARKPLEKSIRKILSPLENEKVVD
jgi:hypothetical protein